MLGLGPIEMEEGLQTTCGLSKRGAMGTEILIYSRRSRDKASTDLCKPGHRELSGVVLARETKFA